jgi:hypothetical protein
LLSHLPYTYTHQYPTLFRHLSWLMVVVLSLLSSSPPGSHAFGTTPTRCQHSSSTSGITHPTPSLLSQRQLSKPKNDIFHNGRWVRAGKDVPVFLLLSSSSSSSLSSHTTTTVPTTLNEALQVFFGSRQFHGPRLIVLFLSVLLYHRIELGFTTSTTTSVLQEIGVAGTAVVFWWFQEHVMHQHLLHSPPFNQS